MVYSNLPVLYRRLRWQTKVRLGPLEKLYSSLPNLNGRIALGKILVVDLEMTGLDPKVDQILSFGWVAINDGFIEYSSGQHKRCYAQEAVGNSVVIHGLSDQQVAGAPSISAAMSLLLNEMIGCTLVFHHASLDIAFLQKASLECFGAPLLFPYLDTMTIEQKMLERSGKAGPLQLDRCRARYGLPQASAHNALSDALATAELFVAQLAKKDARNYTFAQLGAQWA